MKKNIPLIILLGLLTIGCNTGHKGLNDALSALDSLIPQNSAVMAQTREFKINLRKGIENLLLSVSYTFKAAGLEKDAQRMELIRKKIKEDPSLTNDPEKLKEVMAEVNLAVGKANEISAKQKFNKQEAQKYVGQGLLYTGVAIIWDVKAVNNASNLIQVVPKAIQANPLEALHLNTYLGVAQLALENIPSQLKNLKAIRDNLSDYSKKHDIEQPCKADIEEKLKQEKVEVSSEDI